MSCPPDGEVGEPPRISARTAALIAREPAMRRLRIRYRADSAVYEELLSLAVIGLAYEAGRANATANATGIVIEAPAADDCPMTTSQAAAAAGVTPNAIRRAAREGRLAARRPAGRWLTDAASVAWYARGLAGG
jgi:hypothetical protein